jgi:hypothetical protein
MIRSFLGLAAVLSLVTAGRSQDVKPLKVGDAMPGPFRMFVAYDGRFSTGPAPQGDAAVPMKSAADDRKLHPNDRTDRMHCYICEAELNPTIAIFARTPAAADAPAVTVAKAISPLVSDYKANRLGSFVAFLTLGKEYQLEDGRDEKANTVRETAKQANAPNVPFGLAAGKSGQTDLHGLQEGHDLTIILFDRMKVVQIWTFAADQPPDDAKIKELTAAIVNHVKK